MIAEFLQEATEIFDAWVVINLKRRITNNAWVVISAIPKSS